MVDFIEGAIKNIRSDPDNGAPIEVIIGHEPSQGDELIERLRSLGVAHINRGPFNTLLISTIEEKIALICELEYIEDIELNSKGEILSAGN